MASSYPTAPGPKMPLDKDGTVAWAGTSDNEGWGFLDTTTIAQGTLTQMGYHQDTDQDTWWGESDRSPSHYDPSYHAYIFPERRDIVGLNWFWRNASVASSRFFVEVSSDSTNGISGNWVSVYNGVSIGGQDEPTAPYKFWSTYGSYSSFFANRLFFQSVTLTNIRSIRFLLGISTGLLGGQMQCAEFHCYGRMTAGQTPDRLLFIDNDTGLEFVTVWDWGDIPRGITLDKNFYVKNNSATYTANNFTLDIQEFFGGSAAWHQVKQTGGAFADTLAITSIAPSARFPALPNVCTLRVSIPGNTAVLGPHESRLLALPGTWS